MIFYLNFAMTTGSLNVLSGQVEQSGRAKEVTGVGIHWYFTAKGAKTAKDSAALALRSLRCSIS